MSQITPLEVVGRDEQLVNFFRDALRKSGFDDGAKDKVIARGGEAQEGWMNVISHLAETPKPVRMNRRQLFAACQKDGMRLYGGTPANADCAGQNLTLVGDLPELLYDLDETFRRQKMGEAPYKLNFEQMMGLGCGLCSVEETLAYLRAYFQKHQRMPAPSGWLRCRNNSSYSDCSLNVRWYSDYDVSVNNVVRLDQSPALGGLLRK